MRSYRFRLREEADFFNPRLLSEREEFDLIIISGATCSVKASISSTAIIFVPPIILENQFASEEILEGQEKSED